MRIWTIDSIRQHRAIKLFILSVATGALIFLCAMDRDILTTVVARTMTFEGVTDASPREGNTWNMAGAVLCILETDEGMLAGARKYFNEIDSSSDATEVDVYRIDAEGKISPTAHDQHKKRYCPNTRWLEIRFASNTSTNVTDPLFLELNTETKVQLLQPNADTIQAYLTTDSSSVGSVGYDVDLAGGFPLGHTTVIVFPKERMGRLLVLPLRLDQARVGTQVTAFEHQPMREGRIVMRTKVRGAGRYVVLDEPLDPGDEASFISKHEACDLRSKQVTSWGFVRAFDEPQGTDMEIVMHHSNAHVCVSRFGAGTYMMKPAFFDRLRFDPIALAIIPLIFFISELMNILTTYGSWRERDRKRK